MTDERDTALRRRRPAARSKVHDFTVRVIEGPDTGRALAIAASHPTRVLVGQSPACELKLADPTVSRRHAALTPTERGLLVVDLGSRNGTSVGDVEIVEAYVDDGAIVQVGSTLLRVERNAAEAEAPRGDGFGRLVGSSPEMRRLYPLCEKLAASDIPVLVEGETGTGKEVLAESLHEQGARAPGPFVVFDCTAVPATMLEAELFGHERGAFTGAVSSRKGVFEQAHGGTLFIDEIGELDLALQPKLLRAIERSEVRRVGGDRWTRVDVRVVTATRRDLEREIQDGRFRDDLFFRIGVGRVELPPLRRRRGDVARLTEHFWRELGGALPVPYDVVQRFESYDWPGNVRELRNAVARRLALGELPPSHAKVEREEKKESKPPPPEDELGRLLEQGLSFFEARARLLEAFEQRYIAHTLAAHGGDTRLSAESAGMTRRYFQALRARHGR